MVKDVYKQRLDHHLELARILVALFVCRHSSMGFLVISQLKVREIEDLDNAHVSHYQCIVKICFIIGIVSNDGQYPSAHSFDQDQLLAIGPMCRYAQDLSLILKIIADKNADLLKLNQKVDISKIKVSKLNFQIKIFKLKIKFKYLNCNT